jgi:hypothetical protein
MRLLERDTNTKVCTPDDPAKNLQAVFRHDQRKVCRDSCWITYFQLGARQRKIAKVARYLFAAVLDPGRLHYAEAGCCSGFHHILVISTGRRNTLS